MFNILASVIRWLTLSRQVNNYTFNEEKDILFQSQEPHYLTFSIFSLGYFLSHWSSVAFGVDSCDCGHPVVVPFNYSSIFYIIFVTKMLSVKQCDESAKGEFSKVTETPVSIVLFRFSHLHFCWFPCKTTPVLWLSTDCKKQQGSAHYMEKKTTFCMVGLCRSLFFRLGGKGAHSLWRVSQKTWFSFIMAWRNRPDSRVERCSA